jgi:tetratricopeptide (TPR) repeat protein
MTRRYWILAATVCAGVVAIWLLTRPKPSPQPATSDYVNPSLCAACHQEIARTYRLTGMGRSFFRPRSENVVEDYQTRNTLYHRASDRTYTMVARDGRWFQRRHQTGFDGAQTNIVETPIDYVIGSGNHARSYLHRTGEGKLVELPVTWYSEKGGYWAMSPGYDRAEQSDFRRAISFECMSCHNGYPASAPTTDLIFDPDIPQGIDCQRCHGPGSSHIRQASSGATPESIRSAIVNPSRLSRERQLDVCMQCHLQTTSLRSPDSIRRYDRPPFTYRPGEALQDYAVFFEFANNTDRFEIDHAAYRLRKSKCFEKSQMTCTTCHDPHQAAQGLLHYEAICRNCHQSAHSNSMAAVGKTCLDCHMPKRRAEDVVHVVMTDHYIQKRPPAKDALAPREEIHQPGASEMAIYDPAQVSSADAALYLGVANAQQRATPKLADLEAAIERYHPSHPEFYFELGRAYVKSGNLAKGIHWLDEALRIRGDFLPALKESGAALLDAGELSRAALVLERASSRDAEALVDLGNVYLRQGRLDAAEQVLQKAIGINPDLPAAHNLLGLVRLRNADSRSAEAEFREAIRLDPDLAEAHNNLGNLLAEEGDLRQATFHFKKAIAADPENVDAHYNLGQALAAGGSMRDALNEFQVAVRIKPDLAKAHCDLGRLLAILGRPGEAEQQFRLTLQLSPDFYAAHFGMGQILAALGDVQQAKTYFEKATHSPDPGLRKVAEAALLSLR